MDPKAELERLNRLRTEKMRQIADKRERVEEVRKRREAKQAARKVDTTGMSVIQAKMAEGAAKDKLLDERLRNSSCVQSLLAQVLTGDAAAGKKALAQKPLEELSEHAKQMVPVSCAADVALSFQQEFALNRVTVAPRNLTKYERACQTDISGPEFEDTKKLNAARSAFSIAFTATKLTKLATKARDRALDKELPPGAPGRSMERSKTVSLNGPAARRASIESIRLLSPEDKEKVESSPEFRSFFARTSLLVERALGQDTLETESDGGEREEFEDEDGHGPNFVGRSDHSLDFHPMSHFHDYLDDRKVCHRAVTDVRYSPHHQGIFLASYTVRENAAISDCDGCMLVWNLAIKRRPELAFTCSSKVLSAAFHRFEPHLFYGGTYSGGVVLWDARVQAEPVQRSFPGASNHTAPVHALEQVGSESATTLFTGSSDGRICAWSLASMSEPFDSIDLCYDRKNRRELPVSVMQFPQQETNTLYVGGEDGQVCQCHMHGKVGVQEVYEGHEGPVTGIDIHPSIGGDSELALTSSFDWSVRLWKVRQETAPVLSLDCYDDYVFDVKWHPKHPAVFAAVDGEGHVDLWNLNVSTESPWTRFTSRTKLALNRCHFSPDGRRLVVGDSEGLLTVYSIHREICEPSSKDVMKFEDTLRSLQPVKELVMRAERSERGDMRRQRSGR